MHLHKNQLYLLKQHSESFKSWSVIIRINNEGKSSIMKLGPELNCVLCSFHAEKKTKTIFHFYVITSKYA